MEKAKLKSRLLRKCRGLIHKLAIESISTIVKIALKEDNRAKLPPLRIKIKVSLEPKEQESKKKSPP